MALPSCNRGQSSLSRDWPFFLNQQGDPSASEMRADGATGLAGGANVHAEITQEPHTRRCEVHVSGGRVGLRWLSTYVVAWGYNPGNGEAVLL